LSLNIEKGEIISIYGPNGSGKSTLLKIIAGIVKPDKGKLTFNGENKVTGFVWQNYSESLLPWYSVRRNIELPTEQSAIREVNISQSILEYLEIDVKLDSFPYQLSGGQQQMVAIARALANKPGILLLDEPFSALDTKKREQISASLHKYCKNNKTIVLFISHSLDEAILFGDKLVLLSDKPTCIIDSIDINFDEERNKSLLTGSRFIEFRNKAIESINYQII
jgi:NitT/TauT family transport system ATP-binding protein